MTTLKKHFTIKRTDNHSYISLDILLRKKPLLSLMVVPEHEDSVINTLESNIDLIGNKKQINLFESITIMDKLDDAWLYTVEKTNYFEKLMQLSGEDITEIYVNYISNGVSPDWLTPNEEFDRLIFIDECGEDVLLSRLINCAFICNDEYASKLTLEQITTTVPSTKVVYLHDRGINYQAILNAARTKYSIALSSSTDLDDVVFEGCKHFVGNMFADTLSIEELCKVAYDSKNGLDFKKKIIALAKEYCINENADEGYSEFSMGGYNLEGVNGINKGEFSVSVSGIYMAYLGYAEKIGGGNSHTLEIFKGKKLWKTMWYEFARKHEESLKTKATNAINVDNKRSSKREVKFYMTIDQIQKRLLEEYGLNYSEGYVGKLIKDALLKIRGILETRGVSYEDALELVS